MKYLLQYGVGGGFNDTENYRVEDFDSQAGADMRAYELACDTFDSYDLSQYGIDEDADDEEINEKRESWIDYSAIPYDEEKHKYLVIDF